MRFLFDHNDKLASFLLEQKLVKVLMFLLIFLIGNTSLKAQQVFPVQVTATLIPPHSLSLSDYTFDKADDLMFFMTLIDPIEDSRLVKFRVTILVDGQEVMVTNPNYNPPPIILEQQMMQVFNGADLAGYLNPLNLVSIDGGIGGGLLPAGFNSFCIEVIDIERGVPISDRICGSGFFELIQPPLLELPFCFSEVPVEQTNNLMFSWTPMHQLSLNQPTLVEYEFELVKLLPGIADPNDGFSITTPIFQTTQFQTVLYYLEGNPPLEPGFAYAWRVRAKDTNGNDVFHNGGYSNVCVFTVTGDDNPFDYDNQYFSCMGADCIWGGDLTTIPYTGVIDVGQEIKVGNFKMVTTELTFNGSGYNGEGYIYIPFIHSKLKVAFDNIQINNERRMFSGAVRSIEDNSSVIPPIFSVDNTDDLASLGINAATQFTDAIATNLNNHFESGGSNSLTSVLEGLTEDTAIPIGLPIGIDKTVEDSGAKMTIALTGVEFTALEAKMNAVLITRAEQGGQWFKFGGKGICITPNGIGTPNPTLELLGEVPLNDLGIPITIVGMENGQSNTYLSFTCDGFDEFSITGRHIFDNNIIYPPNDPSGSVVATFNATTRGLTDMMGSVEPLGDFVFKGVEEFVFNVGDTWVDFSLTQNPVGLQFPEGFPEDISNETFRGFYLSNASVALPPIFQTTTSGSIPELLGTSILYAPSGFSGNFLVENLINIGTGDLGGWNYSLDSAYVNILNNGFVNSGFSGKIQLPIMADDEFMHYGGNFLPGPNGIDIDFAVRPDIVTINLIRAAIEFDPDSEISIGRLGGQFQKPTVDLNGTIKLVTGQGDPGFVGGIMDQIESLQQSLADAGLGALIPKFDMEGIRFEGLKIDLDAEDKFKIENIFPQGGGVSFMGFNTSIGSIDFGKLELPDINEIGLPQPDPGVVLRSMDLNMDFAKDLLGALAPKIDFKLIIEEKPNDGSGSGNSGFSIPKFSFNSFDLSFGVPEVAFECGQDLPPLNIDPSPGNLASGSIEGQFETLKVGYFTMTPSFPLQSDNGNGSISGTGTISVDILGPFSNLGVSFNNIQIDQSGRIVAGEVVTSSEAGLINAPDNLPGLLNTVAGQVTGGINDFFKLPVVIGMDASGETARDQGLILTGLTFNPIEAKAQAKVVFEVGNNKYAEFKAEGLTLVPDGIANFDLAIGLAADLDFQPIDGFEPMTFTAYDNVAKTGSFVACDCNGFLEFNLEGAYEFSQDQLISLDNPGEPVKASFKFNTKKWGEFIAALDDMGDFSIAGMDGFEFKISDSYIDFSLEENVEDIVFPDGYNDGATTEAPNNWRGFYIKEISLTLPEDFAIGENAPRPNFAGQNLLIDPQGVTTKLIGKDLVNGDIEGWAFTLDSIGVDVQTNSLVESGLKGTLGMPILEEPFLYAGNLTKDADGFYQMNITPDGTNRLEIPALKSYIELEDQTEIVLKSMPHPSIANKTIFKPYADIYGGLGLSVSNEDFNDPDFTGQAAQDAKDIVENVLGAPIIFNPPSITFKGFKVNHPDLPDGKRYGLDDYEIEGGINIGGYELGLNQLTMIEQPNMDFNGVSLPGFGLKFNVGIPLITFDVEFWAKEQVVNGKNKFSFGKIDVKAQLPTFSCDATCPNNPSNLSVVNTNPGLGQSFQSGGFTIKVTNTNKGEVLIPFLGAKLNVDLNNVGLNAQGELVSGTVETVKDEGMFTGDLISVGTEGGQVQLPLMSELTGAVNTIARLPFSLKENIQKVIGDGVPMPFDFVVVGLRFTPTGTKMDAVLMFETGDPDTPYIKFGASGLCFTPEGVILDQIKMFLAEDISLGDFEMPITIVRGDPDTDGGSYAIFSCDGVENFNLQARYDFDPNKLISLNPNKPNVSATFTISSAKLGQFLAQATMDPFMVPGVDDVIFTIQDAWIDYSDTGNPNQFPTNYNPPSGHGGNSNLWRGFYLRIAKVELPESLKPGDSSERIFFAANNLIFDKGNGLTAEFSANNVLSINDGNINGWGISLDKVAIEIEYSSPKKFSMDGEVYIPITNQNQNIGYSASVNFAGNNNFSGGADLNFTLDVNGTYNIPFLQGAEMKLANSTAGFKYKGGKFEPFANFSGDFNMSFSTSNGAPVNFSMPKLGFQNFTLNYDWKNNYVLTSAPNSGGLSNIGFGAFKFAGKTFQADGSTALSQANTAQPKNEKMGGFPISIKNIKFGNDGDDKKLDFNLMLNFTSPKKGGKGIAADAGFSIYGKLDIPKVMTSQPWKAFTFKKIELSEIFIDIDMGGVELAGGLKFFKSGQLYGGVDYGDGVKGALVMTVDPAISVSVVAQFGSMKRSNGSLHYRYWFADAKFMSQVGIKVSFLGIYGFGGGAYYNMTRGGSSAVSTSTMVNQIKNGANNDPPSAGAPSSDVANNTKLLEPGYSLSGIKYVPKAPNAKGGVNIGIKATLVFGLSNDQIFNADATLEAEFNTKDGLNSISLYGDGYFMARISEREKSKLTASLSVSLNVKKKELLASLTAYLNMRPLIYGSGGNNRVGKACLFLDVSGAPFAPWYVAIGTPSDRLGITALSRNFKGYFMAGYLGNDVRSVVDAKRVQGINTNPPAFPKELAKYDKPSNKANRNNTELHGGNNILFGARIDFNEDETWGLFYASLSGGIGFDVMIRRATNNCSYAANGGRPGINGWVLNGTAYAWFNGSVGVECDFWPFEGERFEILGIKLEADLRIQAPNPVYVKARLKGKYSILGGVVTGYFDEDFSFGKKCNLQFEEQQINPLAGVEIVTDFKPREGAKEVPVMVDEAMAVAFSVDMNKGFSFGSKGAGSPGYISNIVNAMQYKAKVTNAGVYRGNYRVDGNIALYKDNKRVFYGKVTDWDKVPAFDKLTFHPTALLAQTTNHKAKVTVQWYSKLPNQSNWQAQGFAKTHQRSFTTGKRPEKITRDLLAYEAPGYRQRNWTRRFAKAQLHFKKAGFGYFFNPIKASIEYNYFVRVTDLSNGTYQQFPFGVLPRPEYSGTGIAAGATSFFNDLGSLFTGSSEPIIENDAQPSYENTLSNIKNTPHGDNKTIEFNKLNDSPWRLNRNRIYKLEFIGEPIEKENMFTAFFGQLTTSIEDVFRKDDNNYAVKRVRKLDPNSKNSKLETISLYHYHFKTSRYSGLGKKLESLSRYSQSFFTSSWKLKSPGSPSYGGIYPSNSAIALSLKTNEGFDKFDIKRLDLNVHEINKKPEGSNSDHPYYRDMSTVMPITNLWNNGFPTLNYISRYGSYYYAWNSRIRGVDFRNLLNGTHYKNRGAFLMQYNNSGFKELAQSEIDKGTPNPFNKSYALKVLLYFDRIAMQRMHLIQAVDRHQTWHWPTGHGKPSNLKEGYQYYTDRYFVSLNSELPFTPNNPALYNQYSVVGHDIRRENGGGWFNSVPTTTYYTFKHGVKRFKNYGNTTLSLPYLRGSYDHWEMMEEAKNRNAHYQSKIKLPLRF